MRTSKIAQVTALMTAASVSTQEVENSDIPTQCATVCSNIVSVADICDRAFFDDRDERNCICQAANAQQVIPLCAACVGQYDDDDDNGRANDLYGLVSSCSFAFTTFDPYVTYSIASLTVANGSVASVTSSNDRISSATSIGTVSSTPRVTDTGSIASSVSSLASSVFESASSAAISAVGAQITGNSAPEKQAKIKGISALAGAALLFAAAGA